jgi:D-alanyl-lipoteichoic acid acyltransferase DltB (MBOAT superfamily)
MAIGLARLFGIVLPINFYSPYKARNITLFWRRWHITLSRFLREYVYIPLGGNQCGCRRRYINLLLTMLLGGFWHGAGWTFILWGLLHGIYLVVHQIWRTSVHLGNYQQSLLISLLATLLTFIAVTIAWVLFRAPTVSVALLMYQGMLGFNGFALHSSGLQWVWISVGLSIVWFMPNVYQLLHAFNPALTIDENQPITAARFAWQPFRAWAVIIAFIAAGGLLSLTHVSEFLYFQF